MKSKYLRKTMRSFFISPVLQRGDPFDGLFFRHFPASGAGWKRENGRPLATPRAEARG